MMIDSVRKGGGFFYTGGLLNVVIKLMPSHSCICMRNEIKVILKNHVYYLFIYIYYLI